MKWPTVIVETTEGPREAIAPTIVSASRATDIPAFHSEWLIQRLNAGYCKWVNPFNRRSQYVSFSQAKAFIFWTKYAEPLIDRLRAFDRRQITYYFQHTLNDYEQEGLEPNLPPLRDRIESFVRLSECLGKSRVIWRYDPLILCTNLTLDSLVQRIAKVGDRVHPFTEKLVISFADIHAYAKVARNLSKWGGGAREFAPDEIREAARRISELARGWGIELASCCEAVDLTRLGIGHNRCIDDSLLLKLAPSGSELAGLLGSADVAEDQLLGAGGAATPGKLRLKDPGQREACGCVISKDIGAYNTCAHLCAYCYANTSPPTVQKAIGTLKITDEAICP